VKLLTSFILGLLLGFGGITGLQGTKTEADTSALSYFLDVEENSYYDDSVLEMVHKGIIQGYKSGDFGPHDPVSRAQATVMLTRYHRNVVRPLQGKVEYILKHFELGVCGDRQRGPGEECDDGNKNDGDGCSSECLKEQKPEPPVVEPLDCPEGTHPMPTVCTKSIPPHCKYECVDDALGGKCAPCENRCLPLKKVFTMDCKPTTEKFECEYEDGQCVKENSVTDCDSYVCGDGSEHPRCSDDGTVINYLVDPCWASASCDRLEQGLADTFRESRACRTSDDCAVLVRGCSPYLTCGKPVNKGSVGKVKEAIAAFITACPEEEPHACALCIQQTPVCEEGFCRLQEIKTCPEDVKICEDGSITSRNPSLECEFDPCPSDGTACDDDFRICSDGSSVFRDSNAECAFKSCPREDRESVCGNDVCEGLESVECFYSGINCPDNPNYCPQDCQKLACESNSDCSMAGELRYLCTSDGNGANPYLTMLICESGGCIERWRESEAPGASCEDNCRKCY
jgi:cysteine-rich repeat protein